MHSILANTITPLLASAFIYLFILNAVIGAIEGYLLRRWFNGGNRSTLWMLLANYLSAWAGWLAMRFVITPHLDQLLGPRPIERVERIVLLIAIGSFLMTLLIESGFVYLASKKSPRRLGKSLLATLCVNLVTYGLIVWLFCSSTFTLPFNVSVGSLANLGPVSRGTLYWVDRSGRVMASDSRQLSAAAPVAQLKINDAIWPWRLRVQPNDSGKGLDLRARYGVHETTEELEILDNSVVLPNVGSVDAIPQAFDNMNPNRMQALDLRKDIATVKVKYDWYRQYMATDVPGGKNTRLIVGLATFDWNIDEPTILPDEKIVFEWGGQIVLFDPHTQKLAFIALGTCPCFVPQVSAAVNPASSSK